MQPSEQNRAGLPPTMLAINDALSAPFDADDMQAALAVAPGEPPARIVVVPSLGVCPECGDEACAHRPEMLPRAAEALETLAKTSGPVIVAAAGSSAPVALMLAALHPALVRGIVLVRPRLGVGAPRESVFARLLRRLAWPCCVLIGAEPPEAPEPPTTAGVRLSDLGPRLRSIVQPALIVHARGRRCDDFDDAWLLQRELGGMVEMVTIPDGEGRRSNLGEIGLARMQSFVARLPAEPKLAARSPAAAPRSDGMPASGGRALATGRA